MRKIKLIFALIFLSGLIFSCQNDSSNEESNKLENEIIGDWSINAPIGNANYMSSIVYRFKEDKTVLIGYLHTWASFPDNYPEEDSFETALKFYYKSNWTVDGTTLVVVGDLINFTVDVENPESFETLKLQDDIIYNVTNPSSSSFYNEFKKGSSITVWQPDVVYDLTNIKTMDLSEYEFSAASFTGSWRASCCWGFQLQGTEEINALIFDSSGQYHINPDLTYKRTFVFKDPDYFRQNLRRKINMHHRDAYGNPFIVEYYLQDFGINSIGEVNVIKLKGRDRSLTLHKY